MEDSLFLRAVTKEDCDVIFDWANDELTRAQSFNTSKILYEDHVRWFEKKVESSNTYFYILVNDGVDVGTVRVDIVDNIPEYLGDKVGLISYSVAPEHRGRGFGIVILSLLEDKMKDESDISVLVGEVKNTNKASCAIFEFLKYDVCSQDENMTVYVKQL